MKNKLYLSAYLFLAYNLFLVGSEKGTKRYVHRDEYGTHHVTFVDDEVETLGKKIPALNTVLKEMKYGSQAPAKQPYLPREELRKQAPNAYGDDNEKEDPPTRELPEFVRCILAAERNAAKPNSSTTQSASSSTLNNSSCGNNQELPKQTTRRREKVQTRQFVPGDSGSSSSDGDSDCPEEDGRKTLPHRTISASDAGCWGWCTHLARSCCSKHKKR